MTRLEMEDPKREAERGYELLKSGQEREAAAAFKDVLRMEPRNHQVRVDLAYLSIHLRQWGEAVQLLDTAIEEEPESMRLRMDLGYAREELGEYDAAADVFRFVANKPSEFQVQAQKALKDLEDNSSEEARAARRDVFLNEGYDALKRGDRVAAREKFGLALAQDPGKTEIYQQLGYMNIQEGDIASATTNFEGAHLLAPLDDSTVLQLGYLYDSLHNSVKAKQAFERALGSSDPKIRSAAMAALKQLNSSDPRLYFDLYANPYYTARFADRITYAEGQLGWRPVMDWPVSFYLGGRYTEDTRSHSGTEPAIFSDNFASVGPGIRIQPKGYTANLTAEYNVAFNIVRSRDHARSTERDRRVVLADYHYWDKRFLGPLGLITFGQLHPHWAFTDAGGSVGYYSRYNDNIIGYLQIREGIKLWNNDVTAASFYWPVNIVKDKDRDFFNNLVEFGAGIELQPWIRWNLKFRTEYLRGVYFGIEGADRNPYGPNYNDFRALLIYSKRFTLIGAPYDRKGTATYIPPPQSKETGVDWGIVAR